MSRKKARKPRRQRPAGAGKVTVRVECSPGVAVEVVLPGYTGDEYRRAQQRAQAGDFRAPDVWRLIEALSAAIGHDLDASQWGDNDFLKAAAYLGLVSGDEWSPADDAAVAALLRGEGADDGR
ncbi:hypothetical protein [Streptomyces griseosporeus]|uniref:hypothetical protein n=1 Tax=Streptomyces griseosporeus TaxID=1910 RepID=UPI00167D1DAF|nr:hypothetical protein [Streptomyces griseosporeus]GHF57772.1 hypothetical protein GCM10018783_28940 [Streptomyces griseosporeus]